MTGVVVDSSGRAVPRVRVTLVDSSGRLVGTTFSYPDGTFRFDTDTPTGCRIQASLAGFQTATVDCGTGKDVKIALVVSPIEEAVVVTATRTETPASQLPPASRYSMLTTSTVVRTRCSWICCEPLLAP